MLNGYSRGSNESAWWWRGRGAGLAWTRSRRSGGSGGFGGSHWLLGRLRLRFGGCCCWTFITEPPVLTSVLAFLDRSWLAGDCGLVPAGSSIFLPLTFPHFFPAALALGRTGELVGGALAGVSQGNVGGSQREVLAVVDRLDVIPVQPVGRGSPGASLSSASLVTATLVLPHIFAHLFPVLFTFVLICCLAIFLLHTFLLTLVFICAAFPPEPQLRTFLLPGVTTE